MKRLLMWAAGLSLLALVVCGATVLVLINPPLLILVLIAAIISGAVLVTVVIAKIVGYLFSLGGRDDPQ